MSCKFKDYSLGSGAPCCKVLAGGECQFITMEDTCPILFAYPDFQPTEQTDGTEKTSEKTKKN